MSALMFQRLARNFIKNGYFPTDEDTTSRILNAIVPAASGAMRVLDPCAGEGVALAEVKAHLGGDKAEAYGVEYDRERAWHAKGLLDRCIHGDFQDCLVGKRQFGLLWLNPPYGDLVSDKSGGPSDGKGRKRLEKLFYQRALPSLAYGGVLVLIVPHYTLDREFSTWIAGQFDRVCVYKAPEERFKQAIVIGVRRRTADAAPSSLIREQLEAAGRGEGLEVIPEHWDNLPYAVPAATGAEVKFAYSVIEPTQLADELRRWPSLWEQFEVRFAHVETTHRRPLRPLSRWHLALALAAGQVSGVVHAAGGRRFVVKGDTHKEKDVKTEYEELPDGTTSEIRILTDKFVPVIRALDFTPHSSTYGQVITIR
ncbi:MAG: DUF6094 domain-containing protein [Stagnimonas sp.]|nr:DUF6094 domain-containing protein [Stagnimonas sp.]